MRHGEAEDAHPKGDRRRALTDRGRAQASYVAGELQAHGWTPELVIASDAQRARETAEQMIAGLGGTSNLELAPDFYLTGFDRIAQRIAAVEGASCIVVVGHNPGWSDALYQMTGKVLALATADAAVLESTAEAWSKAAFVANAKVRSWRLTGYGQAAFAP